jgi:histidinol-phosphate aminotransferase
LDEVGQVNDMIKLIVEMRGRLVAELNELPMVQKVYPSDANFVLVKMDDARGTYDRLLQKGIVVRDRSKVELCEGCLRITVGTEKENSELIKNLRAIIEK